MSVFLDLVYKDKQGCASLLYLMYNALHMCISVNANVVALGMPGALTWEDLLNRQYRVYRPVHSFDNNECTFWA